MLRTHRSLKASCATPVMKMSSLFYQILQLMEHQWNEIDRGKPTTRRKTCPSATLSTETPHGLTRDRTRASAVEGRRLTAWAMARPNISLFKRVFYLLYETRQPGAKKMHMETIRLMQLQTTPSPKRFLFYLILVTYIHYFTVNLLACRFSTLT
jgi:hypothetical protein